MPANKVAVLIDTKPGEALFYKPDELLAAASVLAEVVRRCESCCICIWEFGGGLDFPKYYSKFPCAEREEKFLEIYIVWEGSRAGS